MRLVALCFVALLLGLPSLSQGAEVAAKCARPPVAKATDSADACPCDDASECAGACADAGKHHSAIACDEIADDCNDVDTCGEADDCAEVSDCLADKIDHALEAAEHLEAADMDELAQKVRQRIAGLQGELLKQKVAELDRLQAEVAELRKTTGQVQQVLVHVEILELSLTKLRELGFEFPCLTGQCAKSPCDACPSQDALAPQVCERSSIVGLINALRKENLLKVLASPTLVTTDGRPASCTVGGEFPMPVIHADGGEEVAFRKFGTQVDLLATLLGGGKLRLDIRPRCTEIDRALSIKTNGVSVPGVRVREIATGFEMELGQTAVLGGAVQERTTSEVKQGTVSITRNDVQTVFLVTPELVTGQSPQTIDFPSARVPRPRPRPR